MARDDSKSAGKPAVRRCPICKSPAATGFMPFCSKRCSDIDLGKWFANAYAIPGNEDDDEAETSAGAAAEDTATAEK
jgi:uncharacterized protein